MVQRLRLLRAAQGKAASRGRIRRFERASAGYLVPVTDARGEHALDVRLHGVGGAPTQRLAGVEAPDLDRDIR